MANSVEDLGSNLMLKLFFWQLSVLVKGAIRFLMLPFYLVKFLLGLGKGGDSDASENPS